MTQAPPHLPLPPCLRHYFKAVLSLPPLLHSTHDTALIADQAWLSAFRHAAVIPEQVTYNGNTRLGFFYQWLWQQLITHHPDYEMVAEEIQLHEAGRTVGAIDFLVKNKCSGELEHWEVAIKFYLAWEQQWPGPNAKDNLDKKAQRMLSHQLPLSDSATYRTQFAHQFGQPTVKRLIMQGRLFTPAYRNDTGSSIAINPAASFGQWCYANECERLALRAITKLDWIAPPRYALLSPTPSLSTVTHPTMAVAPDEQLWFVMPRHWPQGRSEA